ncbi:hypothetical protein RUND412_001192 [Rhizina undulata]
MSLDIPTLLDGEIQNKILRYIFLAYFLYATCLLSAMAIKSLRSYITPQYRGNNPYINNNFTACIFPLTSKALPPPPEPPILTVGGLVLLFGRKRYFSEPYVEMLRKGLRIYEEEAEVLYNKLGALEKENAYLKGRIGCKVNEPASRSGVSGGGGDKRSQKMEARMLAEKGVLEVVNVVGELMTQVDELNNRVIALEKEQPQGNLQAIVRRLILENTSGPISNLGANFTQLKEHLTRLHQELHHFQFQTQNPPISSSSSSAFKALPAPIATTAPNPAAEPEGFSEIMKILQSWANDEALHGREGTVSLEEGSEEFYSALNAVIQASLELNAVQPLARDRETVELVRSGNSDSGNDRDSEAIAKIPGLALLYGDA